MASYYVWSAAAGTGTGATWANAFTTLTTAFATEAAGDTIYVAHDHAESTAGAVTLTSSGTAANPTKVICVNRAGTVPPVSADRRATATVSTTAANSMTFAGWAHYDGIIFTSGSGTTGTSFLIIGTAHYESVRFDNCSLRLGINNANVSTIHSGGSAGSLNGVYVELNNTTVSFASVAHIVSVVSVLRWRNTPAALLGTIPTTLLVPLGSRGSSIECIGVDFSAAGSGKTILAGGGGPQGAAARFIDCKLDAAVTKSQVQAGRGTCEVDFVRCGSSGVNYTVYRQRITGALNEEATIVRTGGASDGTTSLAWKIDTTANCIFSMPFECPPIAIWNDTTGSAVTATVEGIAAALPTDAECWLEVEYLGDASSPQGSFVNDGKADLLATAANQTSSSEVWGGSTAAFKLAVTFTPQQKGWVYARVKVGKASATFYIDPKVTLS